jgi:signal transduction histidine kinase
MDARGLSADFPRPAGEAVPDGSAGSGPFLNSPLFRELSRLMHLPADVAAAPTARDIHRYFQAWLRHICRVARFPVGHVHLFCEELPGAAGLKHVWHVIRKKEFQPVRRNPACIGFPPEFHSRVAAARAPEIVAELYLHPQFQKPEIRKLNLKCAVAVPIFAGVEVRAVSVFFSRGPLSRDSLLVDVIQILGRELGCAIDYRALSLKLTKLQDEERRRLARDLHDTVAQTLCAVLLDLDTVCGESASLSEGARAALTRSISLAGQSLQEIRTFSYLLHPPVLEALGLLPALRVFIEGFSRRSGIRIISELPNCLPHMPQDYEMALFRVVQEGLTNVQRHSSTPSAEVRMTTAAGVLTVYVVNEGTSVPPLEAGGLPVGKTGVGIAGMRERMHVFGGEVHLHSRGGKTILETSVPLPKVARSRQLPLEF